MAKKVILIRHDDDPPDDRVYTWCLRNGLTTEVKRPFAGDLLGAPGDDIAGTVLYGGPYDADSAAAHPFLNAEYRWIGDCLHRRVPMLGICQGALMLAHHLGAETGAADHGLFEFGYYEIAATDAGTGLFPPSLVVGAKHFHAFAIPEGGACLAGNAAFPNQAFRYGDRVYGFQFHPEITVAGFRRWQAAADAPFARAGAQTRAEQDRLMARHDPTVAAWFHGFLDHLFAAAGD